MYVYIIYMYVCRFTCMCVYLIYIHMQVCMYIIYICMYAGMHVCVYIDRKRQRGRETEIEKETCFKELAYVGIVKSKI